MRGPVPPEELPRTAVVLQSPQQDFSLGLPAEARTSLVRLDSGDLVLSLLEPDLPVLPELLRPPPTLPR